MRLAHRDRVQGHDDRATEHHCHVELVWDSDLNATGVTDDGASIQVGPAANLSPRHLMALATSSALMTAFLERATMAGVAVEGYVSSARLRARPGQAPALTITPCVVVATEAARTLVDRLWVEVIRQSPTLHLFGSGVQIEPGVRVVPAVQGERM